MQPDLALSLGSDLHMRALTREDAALLAEATTRESAPSLWGPRPLGPYSQAVHAITAWAHSSLAIPRIWLEIRPGNEPSLRLARRVGYHFDQRLSNHCRDWSNEDAEHDSWHDCLIWVHVSDQALAADHELRPHPFGGYPQ